MRTTACVSSASPDPLARARGFLAEGLRFFGDSSAGLRAAVGSTAYTLGMAAPHDPFERLEKLIFRPVSTRPDWLKAWRHEAQHLLFLARRAVDDDDDELLQELEDQAREMGDMVEARLTAEGL